MLIAALWRNEARLWNDNNVQLTSDPYIKFYEHNLLLSLRRRVYCNNEIFQKIEAKIVANDCMMETSC